MPRHPIRALLGLAVAGLAALIALLINGDVQASLVVLVCAVAAVLIASTSGETPAPPPPPPEEHPAARLVGDILDGIAEPLLVIAHNRVARANRAARELLGAHILGEDVRVAIRHPAAAERLLNPPDMLPAAPVHLVGLGARDQRWEMRVRDLGDGARLVHLLDRTGSYATERMRVDFVANASHELRTPLASLLGYVETLRDETVGTETRQRFLAIMFDEASRMQRLIEDLISLSRIEADKYRAPGDTVDLAGLIDEVRHELSVRADEVIVETTDVPPVRGDRAQLSQLIHNVVGNALKYGREGRPVTITLGPGGGSMVRLSVADEGEGIPPEHIPRLTERFYRVDSGRSRAVGGTGLGLAIVKHVVERHRGRLDIASTVGKGTIVTILLPEQPPAQ
jgi:two-component system phosphate regulon sensor histidine kinase PhoR